MAKSEYIFERGEAIDEGAHGDHDYVFSSGEPVADTGVSEFVFESGTGLGGVGGAGIDNFERGDLSPYVSAKGRISISSDWATVQTSTVWEGSYAVKIDAPNAGDGISAKYGGGLPAYPDVGDTIRWWLWLPSGADAEPTFVLGQSDSMIDDDSSGLEEPGHSVEIEEDGGDFNIFSSTDGNNFSSGSEPNINIPYGEWWYVDIGWPEPDLYRYQAFDKDGNELSTQGENSTPHELTGRGFTIHHNQDGSEAYHDLIKKVNP